jgi:D-alanyl-lipoteichoic acid acyltransferase DltB (MBOAT superfamily)
MNSNQLKSTLFNKAKRNEILFEHILRFLVSYIVFELVLHLTSTFSIHDFYSDISNEFSNTSLLLSLLFKGALFQTKYFLFYGLTNLIHSMCGMRITKLPRCIALIHTNAELWRSFDTGIYEFIKLYLYIPLGGSRSKSSIKQLLTLAASFVFIWYWHGMSLKIRLWCLFNFFMISFESIGFKMLMKNSTTFQTFV